MAKNPEHPVTLMKNNEFVTNLNVGLKQKKQRQATEHQPTSKNIKHTTRVERSGLLELIGTSKIQKNTKAYRKYASMG